jgi:hypothetical protein
VSPLLFANKAMAETAIDTSYDEDKSFSNDDLGSSDNINFASPSASVTSGDFESGTGGDIRDTIIKYEEKAVRKARCLVGFAVIACAISVSVSVYIFAKNGDKESFELEVSFESQEAKSPTKCIACLNYCTDCELLASLVRGICERHQGFGALGSTIQLCADGAVKVCIP